MCVFELPWKHLSDPVQCNQQQNNYLLGSRQHRKIPKALFTLPSLEVLDLSSNELHGPLEDIPNLLSSFLNYINLRSNNFTGHIPKSFYDLTKLGYLWLDSNHFDGTFDLSILWKLKMLESLSLSNNMLSVIDDEDGYRQLPYLPNIRTLRLASCNVTKIPGVLRYTNKLWILDLSNNRINGVIPSWIWVNWKDSMYSLKLSNNMFTSLENFPSFIPMYNLERLQLSSNRLHGNVPIPLTSNLFGASVLDYSNNSFSSILPDFGRYLPNTTYLNLSKNKLYGQIPWSICTMSSLVILDLSYNKFSDMIPSCLMQCGINFRMLKLRHNHLQGVPENIGEGCMLETIDLNSNRIEGEIARSLNNCRNLEVLDIGNNQIIDYFPSWLASMPNLRVLILRSNQLYGSIGGPTESDATSKHFSGLQIIDLASNNFSGSLNSKWFDKLETMMANSSGEGNVLALGRGIPGDYYQESLTFKGIDLTFTKILTTFKMIDFSNNAFDGPIPESIGKLIALHGLNISHNTFTGGIPSKLGNLAQLESLDLSENKLSGLIPQELTILTYLAVLNVSYNNLIGSIPEGSQFSLFTNSSFEGNAGLCGRPLSKQCNSSGTGIPSSTASSHDSVGTILLFVFAGSGFGVGFAVAVVLSVVWQANGGTATISCSTSDAVTLWFFFTGNQ